MVAQEKLKQEGAAVGGKFFPFVRVTPNSQARIMKKMRITRLEALAFRARLKKQNKMKLSIFEVAILERFERTQSRLEWKRVRSVAFIKNFTWRWFGIVPKELRCSNIEVSSTGGIQADFFKYFTGQVEEYRKPLEILKPSPTPVSPKKSEG